MIRRKTNLENSYNLRTGQDSLAPRYHVNDVPLGGNIELNVTENTTLTGDEDVIFVNASVTITFPAAIGGYKKIVVRNLTGTTTLAAASGTIELTSLSTGTSATFAPRLSDNVWYQI